MTRAIRDVQLRFRDHRIARRSGRLLARQAENCNAGLGLNQELLFGMPEGFIREWMSGQRPPRHPLFGDAPAIRQEFVANGGPIVSLLSRKYDRRWYGRTQDVRDVRR